MFPFILLVIISASAVVLLYQNRALKIERDRIKKESTEEAKILFLKSRYASMGETVGNIAHQWKQPLNAIGAIQNSIKAALIFQGDISKDKLLYSVETSFKLLRHLAETIDTFYSFLSQRSNETMSFTVAEELDKVRKITEYSFENSNITLNFDLEINPTIQGNANEFTHAMLNLILNAKDAFDNASTETPHITVHVREKNHTCIITVADNAGGIRLKPIDLVFDLHITTKESGSGLGLFMTKNIIENRFGGKISVKNLKGGACFTIELPYSEYGEHYADMLTSDDKFTLNRINQLSRKIIELEEVEKTLKKWADIFQKAHWGIAIHVGTNNHFDSTNEAFNTLYGYTHEELKDISVPDLFPPETLSVLSDVQQRAFENGYVAFETINKRRDGSTFPVSVELIVAKDDEGEILYHMANVWDLTEKKASEERLLLKKFALDHINDAVFMVDENAIFHYANEGACKALGYAREEFEQMNVGDVDPDWPSERWEEHWEALKKAGSMTMELRHRRKDGSIFPVEVSANYIEFNGKHYNMAIARDITERKEAQKDLLLINKALNNTNDAVYITILGAIIQVNDGACKMLGYSREEFLSMTLFDIDKDVTSEDMEAIGLAITTHGSFRFERKHYTKDGRVLDVEIVTNFFEHEGITYSFSAVRDITEQKKAREELLLKEFALDTINEAVYLIDENSMFHYVNEGACEALGYTRDELLSMGVIHIDPNATGEWWRNHWVALKEEKNFLVETAHRRKDGTLFPIEVSINYFEYNGVGYNLAVVRDITERLALEEQKEHERRERELRALADSSPGMMGIFYMRPDHSICMPYVSPNLIDIFGLQPHDVREDASMLMALTHPDDSQRVYDSIAESAKNMSVWREQYRIIHPTKGERWMESNTMPQPHPDGGTVWYGYVHDITERKHVENTVRLLQHSLEFSLESLFIMDADTKELKFIQVNDAACKTLGYSKEELLGGMGVVDIDPDHNIDALQTHVEALKKVRSFTFETKHKGKNGRIYPVEIRSSYFEYEDKKYILSLSIDITERKAMEEQLIEQNQFLDSLLNAIPVPVFYKDKDTRYKGFNKAFEEFYGKKKEEMIGKGVYDLFPREQAQMFFDADAELFRHGGIQIYEATLRDIWGVDHAVIFHKAVYSDKGGNVIGQIGTILDITERKELEVSLEKERKFLNDAQRVAHTGSWHLDIKQGLLTWSDETYRIFELEKEDVDDLHTTFYEMVHPDDREMVSAPYAETLKSRLPYEIEHRIVMSDGRIKYVIERCEHLYDDDGTPLYSIGTVQEITERKLMEASLQEANERYIQILDNSTDVIYLIEVTADGHFVYVDVNAAYEEVTGISREVVIGLDVNDIEDETFRTILHDKFMTCLKAGKKTDYTADYPFPAGIRTFHSILLPIRDESGRIVRIVGAARDITEYKIMENDLRTALEFNEGIISAIPDLLFEIAPDSTYIGVWAQDETLLATQKELILGKKFRDILPQDAVEASFAAMREVDEKGFSIGKTFSLDLPNGRHWFELSLSKKQTTGNYIALSRDITERKVAEKAILELNTTLEQKVKERTLQLQEAITTLQCEITERENIEKTLRASEETFRAIVENSPDVISRYDLQMRRTYINPLMQYLLDKPLDEVLGKTPREFSPLSDVDVFEQLFDTVVQGKSELEYEGAFTAPWGERRLGNQRIIPEFDEDRNVISVMVIGRDMTERAEAEKRLKMIEMAINSSAEAVYINDKELSIIYVNDEACRMLGYTRDELLSMKILEIDAKYTLEEIDEIIETKIREGKVIFETQHRKKDGSVIDVEVAGSFFIHDEDTILISLVKEI